MLAQIKLVEDTYETDVNTVNKSESESSKKTRNHRRRQRALGQGKQYDNCGYQHPANRKSCPARREDCLKCGMKNHFANRCKEDAKATEESDMHFEETY